MTRRMIALIVLTSELARVFSVVGTFVMPVLAKAYDLRAILFKGGALMMLVVGDARIAMQTNK